MVHMEMTLYHGERERDRLIECVELASIASSCSGAATGDDGTSLTYMTHMAFAMLDCVVWFWYHVLGVLLNGLQNSCASVLTICSVFR